MSAKPDAYCIGVDWGTTHLRAYLLDRDGAILDRYVSGDGIAKCASDSFAVVLDTALSNWPEWTACPVVMSGMIGSRQGWHDMPYVPTPASSGAMVDAIYKLEVVSLPGRRVYLVPGVSHRTQQGWDVMRGEETQLLGAMALTGMDSGWFCLPGTHAKWVHVEGGQLLSFSTHMTGEAHALFSQHGLLGRWMTSTEQEDSPEAFAQGVAIAQTPGGLLHHLFHTRTRSLDGELPVSHQRAFLSGLLIGHEVRHMTKGRPVECVTLVGQSRLTRLYALACQQLSWPSREVEGERAVACGLAWMARNREGLSR